MQKIPKRVLIIGSVGLAILAILGVQILRKDYSLNRTLRNINLKLVQIQHLSRTTAAPFQVQFLQNSYVIQVRNKTTNEWEDYHTEPYPDGITCEKNPFIFLFQKGRLQEIQSLDKSIRILRSVVLRFYTSASSRTRAIIFHQKGEWRVLG